MFVDAFNSIEFRTHGQYNCMVSYGNTLDTVWLSINDTPMFILLLLATGIIAVYIIRKKYGVSLNRIGLERSACYFIVGSFPFLWYFVVMNHSVIHPWMSYRELAITIWAIAAMIYTNLGPKKELALEGSVCSGLGARQGQILHSALGWEKGVVENKVGY